MPEDEPDVAGAATWSPDGNSIIFGRVAGKENGVYRLDMKTNQFSKLPGSDGLYSARLSPDGRYVAALPSDKHHLMLYDFKTATWSELAEGNFFNNSWSHDSRYVYLEQIREGEPMELVRVSTADHKLEHVIDLKDITDTGWPLSLGRDNSPILMRDKSTQEIYALNLETP
jgi:Tol biopolymer transport system component